MLQARPNVLFEAGMALGTHPNRTLLVEVGEVKPFSDIAGRHVVRLSNDTKTRNEIAERLITAGCTVSRIGGHWLSVGNFNVNRVIKTNFSNYAAKDMVEEELFEEYGIFWNKELKKRCLKCKSPLKNSSHGPSVFYCSNCNEKHLLRDLDGNLISEQEAIRKLKNDKKSPEIA